MECENGGPQRKGDVTDQTTGVISARNQRPEGAEMKLPQVCGVWLACFLHISMKKSEKEVEEKACLGDVGKGWSTGNFSF